MPGVEAALCADGRRATSIGGGTRAFAGDDGTALGGRNGHGVIITEYKGKHRGVGE